MEQWITDWLSDFGYWGVFLLIMIENVFPPIPSEIILTLGGFMTTTTSMTILGVIAVATLGSVVGAVILYFIGRQLDVARLEKIVEKHGRWLRVTKQDIHRADAWFDRIGPWAVFLGRLVPLVRSLISIPAGMSNMRFTTFLLFTTLGTVIWNTILVSAGAALGENWHSLVGYFDIYSNIIYVILVVVAIGWLIWFFNKKKKHA